MGNTNDVGILPHQIYDFLHSFRQTMYTRELSSPDS